MKKSTKIILGILLIATLTSISLYRKYLRNQARIEQQEKEREVAREYYIYFEKNLIVALQNVL